jgi:drug/metabolite transporter (DMT)-like permease
MTNFIKGRSTKTLVIASFAAIYIIWGSTYLGILLAIETIPPFFMAGTRFLVAGVFLLTLALWKGERLPGIASIAKLSFSGILMLFIGNGAVTWVEQYLPSGLVAIIVATVPLWFVILDRREWKFYFSNYQIVAGLLIGFTGVILLFAGKAAGDLFTSRSKFISLLVLLAGCIAWTIGTLYSKYTSIKASTTMKVAFQMISTGVLFYPLAFAMNEHKHFSVADVSGQSVLALLYLIFMGSVVAYMAYMWLLSVRPASLVGTYAYVNPVVAVLLGWLVASESISISQAIGLGVIIAGLAIVNISRQKNGGSVKEKHKAAA